MKLKLTFTGIFFALSTCLFGQYQYLDSTFNKDATLRGMKSVPIDYQTSRAIVVDPQGRLIVATSYSATNEIYAFRLKTDGTLDRSFKGIPGDSVSKINHNRIQLVNDVILQPDGKILIGGARYGATVDSTDLMVIRLHSDGRVDSTFGFNGAWVRSFPRNEEVVKLKLQSDGKIIVLGRLNINQTEKAVVVRLTTNGITDNTFNGNQGYYESFNPYSVPEFVSGIDMVNDTMYVGVCYDGNGPVFGVMKINPNGTRAINYFNVGRLDVLIYGVSPTTLKGPFIQPDGQMIYGGTDYSNVYVGYIRQDGSSGNYYAHNNVGSGLSLQKMLWDKNGSIVMVNTVFTNSLSVLKLKNPTQKDSTFADNGVFRMYVNYASSAISHDNNLYFGGHEQIVAGSPNYPMVYKVRMRPLINIIGSDNVLPNSSETYSVQVPAGQNLIYQWSYQGDNVLFFGSSGEATVKVFFGDSATNGKLVCKAMTVSGAPYGMEEKEITVNYNPTDAGQLAKLRCPILVTNCDQGYIDYFTLGSIKNVASGCSNSGYTDYTKSSVADTLIAGSVYSAVLGVEAFELPRYAGIWIDYNNDGDFNGSDEFVAEGVSMSNVLQLNNIILKNKEGYAGPKRLRIRSRLEIPFTAVESCPVQSDLGETEDYLVVLNELSTLEAPQIITPNEDGKNDYFVVRGIDPAIENKLTIFDRWGEVKFSAKNYENNWNGKSSDGERLVPGTYYYMFSTDDEFIRGFIEIRY